MRTLLLSSTALLISGLQAQITIGPADMPVAGDTVRYRTTSAQGIDPAPAGAGMIWDMGFLTPDLERADTVVTVSSTPFIYQFFFNNGILYPDHHANFALRGLGFNFQVLTVSDVYDYFKNDGTGFRNVGFGANVNGVPTSVRRLPVDRIHSFPMNFGDMDTSYSTFAVSIPNTFSFTQRQWRFNEVDGYGTLYLPADTFEVLRVKSVLQRTDSAYIVQFGQGFNFPEPESIEYKWIAQGMDEPVLVVTTVGGQATTARFYYQPEDITTAVQPHLIPGTLDVFPNPATDNVVIRVPNDMDGTITLLDAEGRTVRGGMIARKGSLERIDLDGVAPGLYNVTMTGSGGAQRVQLVVQ